MNIVHWVCVCLLAGLFFTCGPVPASAAQPVREAETPAPAPAMPRTAGDGPTMGLLGVSCLVIATALRVALDRSGSKS